ncbi:MAG: tRNA dihydrouridine synthase DusB [Gammaproteobacteria bacterium]
MPAIGPYTLRSPALLAPMAGITDAPFRALCRRYGAGYTVAEMVSARPELRHTRKSQLRSQISGDPEPRAMQIVGADVETLVESALVNVGQGAQIIDINMGCPAKKVCRKAAGSALLTDEGLVTEILQGVAGAVSVPVTLKMRTGWDLQHRNALKVATIAERAGISALTIHGRSRACGFRGSAEYATIALVKENVSIPVFANGDITTPQQAARVLNMTGADAVVIGRGAQGRPWLLASPEIEEILQVIRHHLRALHLYYGEHQGVGIARKHFGWYCLNWGEAGKRLKKAFNQLQSAEAQLSLLETGLFARKAHSGGNDDLALAGVNVAI